MKYIKTLKIDIDKKNFGVIPSVQYDSNTRFLHIQLFNSSRPLNITGCSVVLAGIKPDGNSIFNSCDIINPEIGFIQAEVTEQMNAIPGDINCEIKIYDGNGVLTSKQFVINVTASCTSREIESTGEFNALTYALSKAQKFENDINNKRDKSVKINRDDMDTSSNSKKLGLNNLADEVHAAISGEAPANPIIPDGSLTTEKYADDSITVPKLNQEVYKEASNYIFSIIEQGSYDVVERKTNIISEDMYGSITTNADNTYTLSAGGYKQFIVKMGNDLIPNKPFSIKIPVLAIPEGSEIITRYRHSGGYDNVKHKLSILNGMGMISNVVYPENATAIEVLIDNRGGSGQLIYGIPSIITSGIPFTTTSMTLQDVEDAMNITNHIVGGDGSLSIQDMKIKRPANCTEVRAVDSYISTNKEKGITIQNHDQNGYLFFYYTATNGLDPGQPISASVDIVEDSASATVILRFYKESGQIGSSIALSRMDKRFIKTGIYIPADTTRIEYRIDNRNKNGNALTINNIKLVNGGQVDELKVPYPEINFNSAYINLNLFPNPNCNSLSWINYIQGTPIREIVDNGIKFSSSSASTKCIGYEFTKGFTPGEDMPFTVYISDFAKSDSSVSEFDFNIICYDNEKKELGRITEYIARTGDYSNKLNIPENTALIRLRFDLAGIDNYYTISRIHLGGKQVLLSNMLTRDDIQGLSSSDSKVVYVSPNGDDNNEGTVELPKATVNSALLVGAGDIRLFGGVYYQTINLELCKHKKLSVSRHEVNKEVTFLDPDRIVCDTETLVDGYTKVYKSDITKNFSASNIWLFQDGIVDDTTLITDEERHPLQRGYKYRCYDTKIQKCSSTTLNEALQEIEKASEYKWYAENGVLYFSRPSDVNFINPICCSNGKNLFSNTSGMKLKVSGISSKYLIFGIQSTINSEIADCKASNVCGAGAFVYNSALNCKFIKCEATRAFNGNNGDGFNGHCSNTGDIYSKQLTATFIDCWSHDNNDDGYSDHERAETTIIGGLYEYNKKGGVTPSYGSHVTCYDTYSRRNYCGFNYVGSRDEAEGGMYGQLTCYGCVAENNTRGGEKTGFNINGYKNTMKLINCKSIGHDIGYKASNSDNTVELIDCGSYQDKVARSRNGTFIIKNTTIVE